MENIDCMDKRIGNSIEISKKVYDELQNKTKIFFTVITILFIGYNLWR